MAKQTRSRNCARAGAERGAAACREVVDLEAYLHSLRKPELVELIVRAAAGHSDLREHVLSHRALANCEVSELIARVRREIASACEPSIWTARWDQPSQAPDYSRVQRGLAGLLDCGYPDAVVELGPELLEAGVEQIERSHDDGDISMEIDSCMEVVERALNASPRSDAEKVLLALEWSLADEYGLLRSLDPVLEARRSKRTRSAVADELASWLDGAGGPGGPWREGRDRGPIVGQLVEALDSAGREAEADRVCEAEAVEGRGYERWVLRLRAAKRLDDAQEWAERGVAALQANEPGTAARLRGHLLDMARRRRRWPLAAAYLGERFFEGPTVEALMELLAAAERAGAALEVRRAACRFLETGRRPGRSKAWPLPPTGLPDSPRSEDRNGGHWEVLRELAIAEGRSTDVLRWHDRIGKQGGPRWGQSSRSVDVSVARAVSDTHPERAIKIFRAVALECIETKKPAEYEVAGGTVGGGAGAARRRGARGGVDGPVGRAPGEPWTQASADGSAGRARGGGRPRLAGGQGLAGAGGIEFGCRGRGGRDPWCRSCRPGRLCVYCTSSSGALARGSQRNPKPMPLPRVEQS